MSMTESEATKVLKNITKHTWVDDDDWVMDSAFAKAYEMAITALEEIQQYRAIGTVSEFRELKEKATAKAPYLFGDGYADGVLVYDEWNCPNCDTNYEVDFEHYDYCPMCGQHIDWSEGKE